MQFINLIILLSYCLLHVHVTRKLRAHQVSVAAFYTVSQKQAFLATIAIFAQCIVIVVP